MNLVLLFKEDFISDNIVLIHGRRAEHILFTHKADTGKKLTVGLLDDKIGIGTVLNISSGKIKIEVSLENKPPKPLPVTLLLALPRPKSLKKALHVATTLGIKKIFLIETWKVEKSYWQSPLLQPEDLKEQLLLGLEQAKDTVLPEVIFKKRFKPFIEDEIPNLIKNTFSLIAHPINALPCPYNINKPVTLAIGPEGGFTDFEVNKFLETGFTPVTTGPRIHRVEFAIPAIISKLF